MIDDFILGGLVQIDGAFTDADGDPVDPTSLTLMVEAPDATETPVDPGTFVHVGTGLYHASYLPTQPGTHRYLWSGSGARPVAADGEFYVREPLTTAPEGWQPPSASQVWEESRIDFAALGYTPGKLEPLVAESVGWVANVTGRLLDSSLPAVDQALARAAIRMRVEQTVQRSKSDNVEAAGSEGVQSISVSGASVTFRDPRATSGKGLSGIPTTWGALNEVLWALMTDDKRDYWLGLMQGVPVADFAITEFLGHGHGDLGQADRMSSYEDWSFGWGDGWTVG